MEEEQLDIFVQIEKKKEEDEPYFNGLGQPLPWEE
jgi:hypothetical protein